MKIDKKYQLLIWSVICDLIGMASFVIPMVGEFSDVIWAPLSAYFMTKMYQGRDGKVAGVISFLEELGIFGTDLLPTFTLTWVYRYFLKDKLKDVKFPTSKK